MILQIKVIPNAKHIDIKKEGNIYKIHLAAPAIEGKANKLLIEFLAETYNVKKNRIVIKQGIKSRNKLVEII